MTISVDKTKCIGCGVCVQLLPEIFRMDGTGLADASAEADSASDKLKEVLEACPVEAISADSAE